MDGASLAELKTMLQANGWTGTTALCMLLFSLFHFPCGTTTLTLARESEEPEMDARRRRAADSGGHDGLLCRASGGDVAEKYEYKMYYRP